MVSLLQTAASVADHRPVGGRVERAAALSLTTPAYQQRFDADGFRELQLLQFFGCDDSRAPPC
jgi:hypothetical protein